MDVISDIQKLEGLVKKTSCIATTGNGCLNHHAIHYVAFPFGSFVFYFLTLKDLIEDLKVYFLIFITSHYNLRIIQQKVSKKLHKKNY